MANESYTPSGYDSGWAGAILGGMPAVAAMVTMGGYVFGAIGAHGMFLRRRREGYRSVAWFAEARRQVAVYHAFFDEHPHLRKTRRGRHFLRRCRIIEAAIARAKPMHVETP